MSKNSYANYSNLISTVSKQGLSSFSTTESFKKLYIEFILRMSV